MGRGRTKRKEASALNCLQGPDMGIRPFCTQENSSGNLLPSPCGTVGGRGMQRPTCDSVAAGDRGRVFDIAWGGGVLGLGPARAPAPCAPAPCALGERNAGRIGCPFNSALPCHPSKHSSLLCRRAMIMSGCRVAGTILIIITANISRGFTSGWALFYISYIRVLPLHY